MLSRLIHSFSPNLVGINGDVQSDLDTLTFKNVEKLEYLHSIIFKFFYVFECQSVLVRLNITINPSKIRGRMNG